MICCVYGVILKFVPELHITIDSFNIENVTDLWRKVGWRVGSGGYGVYDGYTVVAIGCYGGCEFRGGVYVTPAIM